MERVKFFSINDRSIPFFLERAETILQNFDATQVSEDINDYIELYNITKFLDNQIHHLRWSPAEIKKFNETSRHFHPKIAAHFKTMNNSNVVSFFSQVTMFYQNDFWELYVKHKLYENITKNIFRELLNFSETYWGYALEHHKIVVQYGEAIREFMLEQEDSAEKLLDEFTLMHQRQRNKFHFPKELNNTDREKIIINYINSANPNLNYLQLILTIKNSKDTLTLSNKTLLLAQRRIKEVEALYFNQSTGFITKTTVEFSDDIKESEHNFFEGELCAKYSRSWLEENLDYPTLLNNFIYLFQYVDSQTRILAVSTESQMGIFEKYIFMRSKNSYHTGMAFEQSNQLAFLQLQIYYNLLKNLDIRLESIIEWFFKDYLPSEFNTSIFQIQMPSKDSTFLEKCTNIMPCLESVLKQFKILVEDNVIDFDLLDISSQALKYEQIPSFIKQKYIYGIGQDFQSITSLFFSDQNTLGFDDETTTSYQTLYKRLTEGKIFFDKLPRYQAQMIQWLLDKEYLIKNEDNEIAFKDHQLTLLLKNLYENKVLSYWKYDKSLREKIDYLHSSEVVEFESSLLTRPEQDYFNYYLNRSKFSNGPDLRNKYAHSTSENETLHEQNYMTFLRLFVLIVIKINDDFCIREVCD